MFVSGGFSLTVLPTGLIGSRDLMVVVVTQPGAATGGVEVLGVVVTRDCWLLSRDCRRAGRLFCGAATTAQDQTMSAYKYLIKLQSPDFIFEIAEVKVLLGHTLRKGMR